MSGGTSAGNIITEAAAVYAVRTWVNIAKVDELGVIADSQLDSIIAANWFNNVDDNLIQVNAWMNGTGVAPHTRATVGTIATLNSTVGNVTTVNTTTVNATTVTATTVNGGTINATALAATGLTAGTAVVGSGAISDGVSTADDLVIGNLAGTDRGLTVLSTSVARLCFADTAATLTGFVSYTHATDTMGLGVAGTQEIDLTSSTLAPHVDGGLSLGSSVLKYLAAHATTVTAYSALVVGDATGSPVATINRDTAGNGDLIFAAEGVTGWRWRHAAAGDLTLDRYSGGVYADSIAFGASSVTFPSAVAVTDDLTVSGDLTYLDNSAAELRIGSGSNTATVRLRGASSTFAFNDGAHDVFSFECDGSGMDVYRYAGGVFQDSFSYNSTGFTLPAKVFVGSSSESAPVLSVSKSGAGEARMTFLSDGVARWHWSCDSSEDLNLVRLDSGGSILSTATFSNSTGAWSLPNDVTLTGSGRSFTVGDNTGNATVTVSKSTGGAGAVSFLANAVKRWAINFDSSQNLLFSRYNSSGVLQDSTTLTNSDGSWVFPGGIGVSGQTRRLTSGSGAPAAAATNGDIYWRIDGTISTTFYVRIGGVWTAAVWT
jgi:hypothetical protein